MHRRMWEDYCSRDVSYSTSKARAAADTPGVKNVVGAHYEYYE